MSRCFPYPPPGYVCDRPTGDSLIESIKIEKEQEKIKQENKGKKRREKEHKKEKKERKKENERQKSSTQVADGSQKRKQYCDGFENSVKKSTFANMKHVYLRKEIEPEAEQLERSSLTEEFGQTFVTETLCYSSDGTQSQSKKCKVEQSPTNGICTTQGKVIRFRLKKREPENTLPADDIPSISGRNEDCVPNLIEGRPVKETDYVIPRPEEQLAFNVLPSVRQDTGTLLTNSSLLKKVVKPKSAYDSLFSKWRAPPINFDPMEVSDDDENWLFPSKKQSAEDRAILNAYNGFGFSMRQSWSLQPRAHLLPEADLYALPYTALF